MLPNSTEEADSVAGAIPKENILDEAAEDKSYMTMTEKNAELPWTEQHLKLIRIKVAIAALQELPLRLTPTRIKVFDKQI